MKNIYPHTCKTCKSPARIGKITLCSNYKCKGNRSYRKVLKAIKPVIIKRLDSEGFLICPECSQRAIYADLRCADDHFWKETFMTGDKLEWGGSSCCVYCIYGIKNGRLGWHDVRKEGQ